MRRGLSAAVNLLLLRGGIREEPTFVPSSPNYLLAQNGDRLLAQDGRAILA